VVANGRVQQTQVLLLDDLEEYTNNSERSRIRSATVESAERDQYNMENIVIL